MTKAEAPEGLAIVSGGPDDGARAGVSDAGEGLNRLPTVIERAFELARSGRMQTLAEIERALEAEHHADALPILADLSLRRQLRQEAADARLKRGSGRA